MEEDGTMRIGSLTSFSHITKNEWIQKYIRVLGEAVDMVGGPQIRNIGTIGGNTCNGVTSEDSASTLFAWDAVVELTRTMTVLEDFRIQEFYIKAGRVNLRPGEIQTGILIPKKSYEGYQGHYIKYAMRNAMDIATLGCSANVKLSKDGKVIEDIRIGMVWQDRFLCGLSMQRKVEEESVCPHSRWKKLQNRCFWTSIQETVGEPQSVSGAYCKSVMSTHSKGSNCQGGGCHP